MFGLCELLTKCSSRQHGYTANIRIEPISETLKSGGRWKTFFTTHEAVTTHITSHCVANKANHSAAAFRMLYETSYGNKRLLLRGDPVDPGRTGELFPDVERIPAHFRELVTWSIDRFERGAGHKRPDRVAPVGRFSSILRMRSLGKKLWHDETADEYVRHLREGWE